MTYTQEVEMLAKQRMKQIEKYNEYVEWLENFDFKSFFRPESTEEEVV